VSHAWDQPMELMFVIDLSVLEVEFYFCDAFSFAFEDLSLNFEGVLDLRIILDSF